MKRNQSLRRSVFQAIAAMLAVWIACFALLPHSARLAARADDPDDSALSVDPTGQGDGYSAVLYDNLSGLPTSEANTITQTREGFIWIGCYSGLIRYDGNSFERMGSSQQLASIMSLFVDSQNRLWVGTNDSGAAVMIDGDFVMFGKHDGLTTLSVRSITEDPAGNIYLATTSGLAVVDSDLQLHMLDEPRLSGEYVRMLRSCGNTIWGVTKNGALFTFEDQKLTGFADADTIGVADVHSVLPDPDHPGYAYIGSQGSTLCYCHMQDGFSLEKQVDLSPLRYINDLHFIGENVWICADNGIGFLEDGELRLVEEAMTTAVEGMMVDYQKNVWFVSSQQGVMKIVPNQFTDIFRKYGLTDEVVYSTCVYQDKLLIGTKNSGLIALQQGRICTSVPIEGSVSASGEVFDDTDLLVCMKDSKIRSIIRDSKNNIWFSTFGDQGLMRLTDGKLTKFTEADGLPSNRIRTVFECTDGSYLAACTGGVAVIRDDKVERVYGSADGIANTEVLTVIEGTDGEIIIGTDGGGIYTIGHGQDGEISHFGTEEGLFSDVIMRIKKDISRELYWIITSNSLAYMTADHKITTVSNFPYSNNYDLYENSRGEIWVLSSNGIYVAGADEIIENDDVAHLFYNRDNGLPCISTSNSYSELTADGTLYLAGTTGVAKVNIETPADSVSDIKVAVPYLEADGKYIFPDGNGEFSIPASVKKVTIYSYVYCYSLINPQVTYRLDGFDSTATSVQRSELMPQSFTNLKGGSYRFLIDIQDPHGLTSKELAVKIVKEKKFYELAWVHISALLLGAALLGFAIKRYADHRTKVLTEKAQAQKTLIREIVEAFAKVIDMKDQYTNGHSARVAEYTVMLCQELGIDEETTDTYYCIALLHDIGKIGIPPELLNKDGKLSEDEFSVIKSHSEMGFNALKDISILPELAIGAGAHHERPDGKGYPRGLRGDEIPRVAQIIAVADTFDAMYSDRPYRKRMNFDKAVSIISAARGTQLTADVVDAFLRLVEQGKMRAADDIGGGTTEDIDNLHRKNSQETPQTT